MKLIFKFSDTTYTIDTTVKELIVEVGSNPQNDIIADYLNRAAQSFFTKPLKECMTQLPGLLSCLSHYSKASGDFLDFFRVEESEMQTQQDYIKKESKVVDYLNDSALDSLGLSRYYTHTGAGFRFTLEGKTA